MSEAKVSIILPAYNAEKYLAKAIASILNQTHRHIELIVINDGSKDKTEEVILSFKDERLKYYKNEVNLGLIQTLNYGFSLATGQYISRMDADDIAHPDRLKLQVDFLNNLDHPAIVGGNIIIIDDNDKIVKVPRKVHLEKDENFWIKFRKTPLQHPTVTMSKEIALKFSPFYDLKDVHMEDYAAWLRVNHQYPIYNLEDALLFYRIHDFNITKIYKETQTTNMINYLQKYYLDNLGGKTTHQYLKNLILLKLEKNDDAQKAYLEFLQNANIYIEKYGQKEFVYPDIAYSILTIGLKSGPLKLFTALHFLFSQFNFSTILRALYITASELPRFVLFKFYYRLKYRHLLKVKT